MLSTKSTGSSAMTHETIPLNTESTVASKSTKINIHRNDFFAARNCIAYAGIVGYFLCYSSRIILSVAINEMVVKQQKNETFNEDCPVPGSDRDLSPVTKIISQNHGTFDWSVKEQGDVLAAFFYGYVITQFPAAFIARHFGGKVTFGVGVFGTGICTLLTPVMAYAGVTSLCVLRFLMGLVQGVVFVSMNHLMGVWAPVYERSFYSSLIGSGADAGNIVSPIVAGYLCSLDFLDGWPLVFYLHGLISMVWILFWCRIAADSPSVHPRISSEELYYITGESALTHCHVTTYSNKASTSSTISYNRTLPKFPWKRAFTNLPFLALFVAQFCSNWINLGIMLVLSPYLSRVLNYKISSTGIFSCVPWLCSSSSILLVSYTTDCVIRKGLLPVTIVRKINQSIIGAFISSLFLILAANSGCDTVTTLFFFTLAMVCFSATFSGYHCNNLDIAPNFSGMVFAICNTCAVMPGFILPAFVTYFTQSNEHSPELWRKVFYLLAGINCFGGIVFLLLASGERQKWSLDAGDGCNDDESDEIYLEKRRYEIIESG